MDIKPCPFCGGEADIWAKYGRHGYFAVCECSICSASAKTFFIGRECPDDWGEQQAALRAINAWNRRCPNAEQSN